MWHPILVGFGDSYVSQMSVCFVVLKHTKEWSTHGKHPKTRREQLSAGGVPRVRLLGKPFKAGTKDGSSTAGSDSKADAKMAERTGGPL